MSACRVFRIMYERIQFGGLPGSEWPRGLKPAAHRCRGIAHSQKGYGTTTPGHWILVLVAALASAAAPLWAAPRAHAGPSATSPAVEDFCFLQISDIHISPHPVGGRALGSGDRSVDTITWLCREADKPQDLPPPHPDTPVPSFVIATGDLTEYGIIHETWSDFEKLFAPLSAPLFVTPGNHDNTWTGMLHVMRRRHGGDHYSFDRFGCHFASIDTATPQEPVPSLEQRTLTWLASDLQKVPRGTPIFLWCHHPLSGDEFAKPFEQLRLLDVLADHNAVLLLMGHGHGVRHERWNTLDSVMGGSTYGPNSGYNIISVQGGILRVAYRFQDVTRPMQVVLEKPVAPQPGPRLELLSPLGDRVSTGAIEPPRISGPQVTVTVRVTGGRPAKVAARLDDRESHTADLAPVTTPNDGDGRLEGTLGTVGLLPGLHFVRVTAHFDGLQLDEAREVLLRPPGEAIHAVRARLPAGMKARPLLLGDAVIIATTAGTLSRIALADDAAATAQTLFEFGVEILHAPAVVGDTLYFSAAEKGVHALGWAGTLNWRCDLGAVVYGTPAVDDENVYVGDMEGGVHALDRGTGRVRWSRRHAEFSIEQPILLHDGVLYFGAWDGFVYAVDARDGSLKWKQPGPAGHRSEPKYKSRYYAPADCPPLVIGDRLFVADRAYVLGSYSLSGEYLGDIAADVAAIGAAEDRRSLYARGSGEGLACYHAEGKLRWSDPVVLGRFPCPPTEAGGKVYVCSNRGLLSVHDAEAGRTLWQYQVTPQLHVMAPVAVDRRGSVYVAGMDGTLTCVGRPGE